MNNALYGYILHRRDFRDSSLIIDFFTLQEGLISAVAKGAKRPKSAMRSQLQYFTPLIINTYGRSELLGLKTVEAESAILFLTGRYLLTLLYVNELLCKLLQKHESHPQIYYAYQALIAAMVSQQEIEPNLRRFEMELLKELGYQLQFDVDNKNNEVDDERYYTFNLAEGLMYVSDTESPSKCFCGKVLKKIQVGGFENDETLAAAKRLFRELFAELLQHKTINSRFLFAGVMQSNEGVDNEK